MAEVHVKYGDYLKEIVNEISFELKTDSILHLKYNETYPSLMIGIEDKITENSENHGSLELDGINVLIRALTIIRNQVKNKTMNTGGGNNVSKSCK